MSDVPSSREDQANLLYRIGHRCRQGRSQITSITRAPREGAPNESIVTITIREARRA